MASHTCQHCSSNSLNPLLALGKHAFSTGLLVSRSEVTRQFDLTLVQCSACGLIQLQQPAAAVNLRPFVDWVTYREPEQHLDEVCAKLTALPGLDARSARIMGVTSKDDTTLARLSALGYGAARRLDPAGDLGITQPLANVEAAPEALTSTRAGTIARDHGRADLLITRHILEHAADLDQFLQGLTGLVAPGGYLMLEVPDCTRSLALGDYTMIWEEHSLYFTPETFFRVLERHGFSPALTLNYAYPYENCLILVARQGGVEAPALAGATLPQLLDTGRDYGQRFQDQTDRLRRDLTAAKARRPVALYGAGHLTASFVNYHGLADLIDCVVDDTPQKQGLFLPGSGLEILPSAALLERHIGLCLLGLAPEVEPKIVAKNAAFIAAGGSFRSLLAASPSAFLAAA